MSLEIDGPALMVAMAKAPADFGLSPAQLNALALTIMSGRLKDRTVGLEQLRIMWQRLDPDDCRLALDQCVSKDVAALAKRLDAKNPDLRGSDEAWQRSRIIALIEGAEPAQAATRAPRSSKSPGKSASKAGAVMGSKALASRDVDTLMPPERSEPSAPPPKAGPKKGKKPLS